MSDYAVVAPDGNRWQWWLDADARVIRERDMAGTGTHYSYDEDGHCIAIRESETRHFLYDGRGLLIKETAPDDTLHYRYDAAGRLIRKQVVQPGYRPQVWHYRRDNRNQLRVVDTPTGER
ncbi:hypothetical protein Pcaca03_30750 [Pectobacterium carotovorum subsp. carotovorum]|uniref:Teneurin-like YD-shell domain-containing protein n=1 Tax=Pectobacterium carotovorum subsp. carotovorum TaxID=555 RepID=A0AAI9L1Z2_PECCC|nr:hypothetical protein [Pectobacterium carotovorum]GKX48187.1 hypothetical protein SOASR016_29390 [Pectobacterium carotovorum subsp. carotovorum]GLV70631.1 hypothetical protein Pcaca03_30750 [Pectobacterium carotovorum subsp. carotovorum]